MAHSMRRFPPIFYSLGQSSQPMGHLYESTKPLNTNLLHTSKYFDQEGSNYWHLLLFVYTLLRLIRKTITKNSYANPHANIRNTRTVHPTTLKAHSQCYHPLDFDLYLNLRGMRQHLLRWLCKPWYRGPFLRMEVVVIYWSSQYNHRSSVCVVQWIARCWAIFLMDTKNYWKLM